MKLSNDWETIIFKSVPAMFEKEKTGKKSNTVRRLNTEDSKQLHEAEPYLKTICIKNTETGETFHRKLTDITEWYDITVFSWG